MKNYISINGKQTELTDEQLLQLGIKPQVDFSEYNETDWFYYKLNNNQEWISKNAFREAISIALDRFNCHQGGLLCYKKEVLEFRKATDKEINLIYSKCPKLKPKIEWEDFGEIKGWYVDSVGKIESFFGERSVDSGANTFPTKEEAKACLALSQLCQWRDKYNEGWKPNWEDENFKNCIVFKKEKIIKDCFLSTSQILSFKTTEIRDKFLEDFKDLIEIAKPLL